MPYFDEPWREIAKAAKLRDWATIDAVLEDRKLRGNAQVARGQRDARRELGEEPALPQLERPEPVTILDLSPDECATVEIDNSGFASRYRTKKAA